MIAIVLQIPIVGARYAHALALRALRACEALGCCADVVTCSRHFVVRIVVRIVVRWRELP